MTSCKQPSSVTRPPFHLLALLLTLGTTLTACGLFGPGEESIEAGQETTDEASRPDPGAASTSDATSTESDSGDDTGDNGGEDQDSSDDVALAAVDEAQALSVIREASVETGVAPDQRAGVSGYTPIIRCAEADLTSDELQSLGGTYLFLCINVEIADVWHFTLMNPDGEVIHESRSENGTYDYSLSLLDPFGVYRLEGTSRNGGSVTANYNFDANMTFGLEAAVVDNQPALVIGGYGDTETIELAAYDASQVEAYRFNTLAQPPRLSFSGSLPLLYELGSFELDTEGITVIPLAATDVDQFCIFDSTGPGLVTDPSACWGLDVIDNSPPLLLPDDNRFQLTRTLVDGLGRDDLTVIAPLNTTLNDGTTLSAATVVDLGSGQPVGAAGFVTDAATNKVYVHSWVEEPDMASAFASVCANLDATFKAPAGACPTEAPKLILVPPALPEPIVEVVPPIKPVVDPELFTYPQFIDRELLLKTILQGQLQLQIPEATPDATPDVSSTTAPALTDSTQGESKDG